MMRLRWLLIIMCLAISMIPVGIIGGFEGFQIASAFLGLIIVVTFFVSLFISYFISYPLEKLTKNIDEISKGNLDVELEKSEIFEINNLTDSLNRVMASLKLAIHKVGVKRGEIFEKTVKAKEGVEEKYESLLKSRGTWIWEVDEKGFCKSCSTKVSYALGYKPDEMIGKKIFEFMVPEEAKKYINIFSEITRTKQDYPYTLDSYWLHKDGHNVSVHTQFVPIFDDSGNFRGFRGFARDMIEYKNDEEKIEDLNKKLVYANGRMHENIDEHEKSKDILPRETALDKLNEEEFDYMFIFDENANIIDCNPDVYKKLGYKKDEMLSLNLADFDYLETKKDIQEKINKIKKSGSINFKTIHKKKDGSSVFVSENIQYLKDKNMFRCIVKEDFVA